MDDILKAVRCIYEFEPEDEMELKVYREMTGEKIYDLCKTFQKMGAPPERAAKFMHKITDINNIIDLISK